MFFDVNNRIFLLLTVLELVSELILERNVRIIFFILLINGLFLLIRGILLGILLFLKRICSTRVFNRFNFDSIPFVIFFLLRRKSYLFLIVLWKTILWWFFFLFLLFDTCMLTPNRIIYIWIGIYHYIIFWYRKPLSGIMGMHEIGWLLRILNHHLIIEHHWLHI